MVIKLDLENAYDKLEWSFIRKMLIWFNFLENLIELIMSCISSVSTSLLFKVIRSLYIFLFYAWNSLGS